MTDRRNCIPYTLPAPEPIQPTGLCCQCHERPATEVVHGCPGAITFWCKGCWDAVKDVGLRAALAAHTGLAGDELDIACLVIERLVIGRARYGQWSVTDGRNYPREALDEVLDCQLYAAAALLRAERNGNAND
jgi:hypothetical protein